MKKSSWSQRYHDFDMKKVWFCGMEKVERFGNLLKVGANFFTLGGELEKVIGGELAMRRVHDNPFPARYLV